MKKKLSICFIAFSYYPGQGSTAVFEYSRNVAKLGHKVHVIAAAKSNEKTYEVVDKVVVRRIRVKTTKRRSLETLKFNFLASRILSKIIEDNDVDIAHVFSYTSSFLIKFTSRKVKWIYDIRSGPIEDRKKPSLLYRLVKKFLKFESMFFDAIFVIDEAVKNEILGRFVMKKIFIAPLGADFQKFKPISTNRWLLSRYGIQNKDIVLVYLGSINPKRRIIELIRAMWKACMKIENLRLILLGEGEDLPRLKLFTKTLLLSDKVFFLGYIKYVEVPKFLSAVDIAISYIPIVPAFDSQPSGKTVEYLACSLPVIATNTEGNRRFINNGINGLMCEDDSDSLSKAIIRLCLDVSLRKKLAKNARSSVRKYDWRTIVEEKILLAYRKVLWS
ncbi:glycosyltransferase family 4 protein [Candidatus Bathyarchaeota archaeon]|nr:glycosyltransferase family 4 protein [Candidatus Bathyarchaeota archaeon]